MELKHFNAYSAKWTRQYITCIVDYRKNGRDLWSVDFSTDERTNHDNNFKNIAVRWFVSSSRAFVLRGTRKIIFTPKIIFTSLIFKANDFYACFTKEEMNVLHVSSLWRYIFAAKTLTWYFMFRLKTWCSPRLYNLKSHLIYRKTSVRISVQSKRQDVLFEISTQYFFTLFMRLFGKDEC